MNENVTNFPSSLRYIQILSKHKKKSIFINSLVETQYNLNNIQRILSTSRHIWTGDIKS
jgi:hypothetical protein